VKLTWLGHASFLIETAGGTRVVTDPYDGIGLTFPQVEADYVTISHDHFDHGARQHVGGDFTTFSTQGAHKADGIDINGVLTFHDETGGAERGSNVMFVIEADGVRLCHAGDLGHMPEAAQIEALGTVDILCLPVGGTYTIDAVGATELLGILKPRIAVPMHYLVPGLSLDIADASGFVSGKDSVRQADALEVDAASLPEALDVVVLAPKHG